MSLTVTPQNIDQVTDQGLVSAADNTKTCLQFPDIGDRYALMADHLTSAGTVYTLFSPSAANRTIFEQRGLTDKSTGELTASGQALQQRFCFKYDRYQATGTLAVLAPLVRHLMGQADAQAPRPAPKSAIELKAEKLEAQAKALREQAAREAKEEAEKAAAKAKRAAELKRKKELAALKPLTRRMIAVLEARPEAWGCQRPATLEILEAIAGQKFSHLIGTK